MSKKEYIYNNGRFGANSAISQINKFLVSQDIDTQGGRIESTTSVKKLSAHSPLVITIWGQSTAPSNPLHYFDSSLLGKEESKAEMLQAWVGDLSFPTNNQGWPTWLEAATARVMRCNVRFARTKKRLRGTHVRMHAKKVQLAKSQLQRDPTNEEVRDILSDSQSKLAKIFQDHVRRN